MCPRGYTQEHLVLPSDVSLGRLKVLCQGFERDHFPNQLISVRGCSASLFEKRSPIRVHGEAVAGHGRMVRYERRSLA